MIFLKTPTSQESENLILLVEPTDSALAVKSDIQNLYPQYLGQKQHMCHGGVELDNDCSLAAYGVQDDDGIVLYDPESELLAVHFSMPWSLTKGYLLVLAISSRRPSKLLIFTIGLLQSK